MLAMNLTFLSPLKIASESSAMSKRSYSDSQLFDWEPVHSATAAVIGRLNPTNIKDFPRKQSTLHADDQATSVMNVLNAKKSRIFRFCLICAYVTIIWALKRLQKKALLEGKSNLIA